MDMDTKGNFLAVCLLDSLEDQNESAVITTLTRYNANPNFIIQDRGIAPIHYATGMENIEFAERIMKLLLFSHKGDPNVRSDENLTPMHIAAMYGRTNIVKMLLEKGGDIRATDIENKTPIQYAVYEHHFDVIKIMQNHVFENKFNSAKQKIAITVDQPKSPSHTENDSNTVTQPANHNLMSVKSLEAKKFTPNRINYNFDVTSPYFFNITHRRNKTALSNEPNRPSPVQTQSSTPIELQLRRENLFTLTQENISEVAQNLSPDRSRASLIKNWRDKVEKSRTNRSFLKKYTDIDSFLSGIMTDENLDFNNTLLTLDRSDDDDENCPPQEKPFTRTSFGKMFENIDNAKTDSFITAEDNNEFLSAPTNDESNFIRSPKDNSQYIVQMSEAYVHTDNENGLVFYEKKLLVNQNKPSSLAGSDCSPNKTQSSISTNLTIPLDYETEALRAELTHFGEPPGPITKSTKKLYIKQLVKYKRNTERMIALRNTKKNNDKLETSFSVELNRTVSNIDWFNRIPEHLDFERQMCDFFKTDSRAVNRKLREGHLKQSFIYLLIDPRISCNLPAESAFIDKHDIWKIFVKSIFYVGKGKSVRPYSHMYDALKFYSRSAASHEESGHFGNALNKRIEPFKSPSKPIVSSKKLERILDIWSTGKGVVCLHIFHNILPAEAYTREAAIIEALSLQHLTNMKRGDYYGPTQSWTMRCKKNVGILLLFKAMQIFLAEGESQLSPSDLI